MATSDTATRALVGLDELRDGQVIVVGDEASRDTLAHISGRNVVSWHGGYDGIADADWLPIARRDVVIWPDAGDLGRKMANTVAARLVSVGCSVKVLDFAGWRESPLSDGWSAADVVAEFEGVDQFGLGPGLRPDRNLQRSRPARLADRG